MPLPDKSFAERLCDALAAGDDAAWHTLESAGYAPWESLMGVFPREPGRWKVTRPTLLALLLKQPSMERAHRWLNRYALPEVRPLPALLARWGRQTATLPPEQLAAQRQRAQHAVDAASMHQIFSNFNGPQWQEEFVGLLAVAATSPHAWAWPMALRLVQRHGNPATFNDQVAVAFHQALDHRGSALYARWTSEGLHLVDSKQWHPTKAAPMPFGEAFPRHGTPVSDTRIWPKLPPVQAVMPHPEPTTRLAGLMRGPATTPASWDLLIQLGLHPADSISSDDHQTLVPRGKIKSFLPTSALLLAFTQHPDVFARWPEAQAALLDPALRGPLWASPSLTLSQRQQIWAGVRAHEPARASHAWWAETIVPALYDVRNPSEVDFQALRWPLPPNTLLQQRQVITADLQKRFLEGLQQGWWSPAALANAPPLKMASMGYPVWPNEVTVNGPAQLWLWFQAVGSPDVAKALLQAGWDLTTPWKDPCEPADALPRSGLDRLIEMCRFQRLADLQQAGVDLGRLDDPTSPICRIQLALAHHQTLQAMRVTKPDQAVGQHLLDQERAAARSLILQSTPVTPKRPRHRA